MNILVVNPKVTKYGGIEKYIVEIFSRLSVRHKIIVLTQEKDVEIEGVDIIVKNKFKGPLYFSILLNHFFNYFTVKKIKKQYNIDIVFSNGSCLLLTDIVVAHSVHIAGLLKKIKENKNIKSFLSLFWLNNLIIILFEFFIFKFTSKKILAVSSGIKKELIDLLSIKEDKISVISNGVDVNKFIRNEEDRLNIRKFLSIKDDELLLIFVGHEFERKGILFVIEAIAKADSTKIKLAVLGKDNPQKYVKLAKEMGIESRIFFLGQIKESIEKYYSAADVFVFPTLYEAFSLATLEASASGLPLLVTKVNGTEELIKSRVNGFFIKRDSDDILNKLNMLVSNRRLLEQLSKNSFKIAQQYSWDEVALKIEKEIICLDVKSNSNSTNI